MTTLTDPAEAYPRVMFVDAPTLDATARFDFHDRANPQCATWPLKDGWSLGAPSVEGDLDAVNVEYGDRRLSFTLVVNGLKAHALAKQARLAKQLLRHRNWVAFKLDKHSPWVWFRTWRADPQEMSFEQVYDDDLRKDVWHIGISLPAENFAYGRRVTHSAVTVAQNSSGTNPMQFTLPTIKGEAPTHLRVEIAPAALSGRPELAWLVACVSGTADMEYPFVDIGTGDGFTALNGTSGGQSGSAFFNGTYRSNDLTSTMLPRLAGAFPVLPRGRYKVLLRIPADADATDQTVLFRLDRNAASDFPVLGPLAPAALDAADANRQLWVDLGQHEIPGGSGMLPDDVSLVPVGADFSLAIQGTAEINLDGFLFVPIDGPEVTSATVLKLIGPLAQPLNGLQIGTFDGDDEVYRTRNAGDGFLVDAIPNLIGGFPKVDPAADQSVLFVMAVDNGVGASGSDYITKRTAAAQVIVSYHPRMLYLGDGS